MGRAVRHRTHLEDGNRWNLWYAHADGAAQTGIADDRDAALDLICQATGLQPGELDRSGLLLYGVEMLGVSRDRERYANLHDGRYDVPEHAMLYARERLNREPYSAAGRVVLGIGEHRVRIQTAWP